MEVKVTGNKMVVTLDLTTGRPSATGKTLVVFTTGGFQQVAGTNMKVNLTVIKPR